MALATHNTKPMIQNALRSLFARIGCEVGIDIFKASGDRLCDLQCIGNVIAPNDALPLVMVKIPLAAVAAV